MLYAAQEPVSVEMYSTLRLRVPVWIQPAVTQMRPVSAVYFSKTSEVEVLSENYVGEKRKEIKISF
jgi:hypothetical protein